jgi:hypothetical protein
MDKTFPYYDSVACIECINNLPPADIEPRPDASNDNQFEDFMDSYNDTDIPINEPRINFDMNSASYIETNPDYMNDLISSQVEYEDDWYFALNTQIYRVPYEIEILDDTVRYDIKNNWEGVEWIGTIFGNYIAWK